MLNCELMIPLEYSGDIRHDERNMHSNLKMKSLYVLLVKHMNLLSVKREK